MQDTIKPMTLGAFTNGHERALATMARNCAGPWRETRATAALIIRLARQLGVEKYGIALVREARAQYLERQTTEQRYWQRRFPRGDALREDYITGRTRGA